MKKKTGINRRGFIKTSALSSGAILISSGVNARPAGKSNTLKSKNIITRQLGRTGITLPVVSAGKMPFENAQITLEAYEKGIRYFDTAYMYNDGKHEKMLGEVLPKLKRDSFVIGTKLAVNGLKWGDANFNKEVFLEHFDVSLKRLKLSYVDILFVHNVNSREVVLQPEIIETLQQLKDKGLVKHTGVSTHSNEPEVIQAAMDSKFYDVVMTSYNFKQGHVREVEQKIKAAAEAGIGIIAMKNMAGGFLDKEKTQPVNYKAALKWALKNPAVCTVVPTMKTFDQLEMNTSVMTDITMSEQELKDLEAGKELVGLYCDGCRQCIPQCRNNIQIPDLMRSYMYSYGYGENKEAHEVVANAISSNNPCSGCSHCTVQCIKGFNVAVKVSDISRIYNVPKEFLA